MNTPKDLKLSRRSKASKSLKLENYELQVHRANIVMALNKAERRRELEMNPREDPIVQAVVWGYYIPMTCCSTGQVPTEEEFLKMDELELDKWYEAVAEINPHWFPSQDDSQKKESSQTDSTSG